MKKSFNADHLRFRGRITGALAAFGFALLAAAAPDARAADVTYERLLNPEPHNWLMNHHDFGSQRYSVLDKINKSNVKGLKLAFAVALGGASPNEYLEATPLVDDGFMYITDVWGVVYKIDVRSGTHGRILWKMDPGQQKPDRNRGVALWNNLVISVTGLDGRVIATDKETGKIVWDKNLRDQEGMEISAAPLALKDTIIVGGSGGDNGVRCWVASLDAKTGELKWKTFAVPAPGEPGSETWKDKANAWQTGGGAFYVTGSYDPATNLTYWGSGNAAPRYDSAYRPGDNLFTNSSIAFDAATGKITWYFQHTANDNRDYDSAGSQIIIDGKVGGEDRKLLVHANRNGFNYTHDRQNGQFLKAVQYADKVTWTKGIDPKTGRPVDYDPAKDVQNFALPWKGGTDVLKNACPDVHGGTNFWPPAYSQKTQAPLHRRQRRLRQHHARPDRAREGQVRRRQLRQRGPHHGIARGGRSHLGRAQDAQAPPLPQPQRRARHRRRHRGDRDARRHDPGLRRPDAGGAVEGQCRLGLRRAADDLHGRRQAVHRHRLGHRRRGARQARALAGDEDAVERHRAVRVRAVTRCDGRRPLSALMLRSIAAPRSMRPPRARPRCDASRSSGPRHEPGRRILRDARTREGHSN